MKSGFAVILFIALVIPDVTDAVALEDATPSAQAQGGNGIRLNFRGASLDTVLDYFSQAVGFAIVKQVNVEAEVDVVSRQPLTQEEAVDLLNTVLYEKGYAAIRRGRTLVIVKREEAKQKDIPVQTGNVAEAIPRTDEMVTQIVPVRYVDAVKLIENLQPLLPSYAGMSANESSNAVIITDTQNNVHRMVKIIESLDTSISTIASIRVFLLQYADASDLAETITQLFQSEDSSSRWNQRTGFRFGRLGGPGSEMGAMGGASEPQTSSEARRAAARVVAVADDKTNSLIVNAPADLMPTIEAIVKEVDTPTEDLTEVRVFTLKQADASELAEQIQELFPDESSSSQNPFAPRFGPGGGGPGMMPGMGGGSEQTTTSDRKLEQTTVRCVADPRTNSVLVLAAHETMVQIAQMVEQLDCDPARKKKVFVYHLEYADVDNVAEILRNIFENEYSSTNRSETSDTNANTLSNRTVSTDSSGSQSIRSSD
ncbi:MAG TPA: secretin N-terminal domain-containing protein [bacterium]|nr:secretin N-terminal domain-containing protein [bacterium]